MLTLEELRTEVEAGAVDTVVAAFTDMQGRLMGKRVDADYFLAESVDHGLEGCNYLLALDMEMEPQRGYAMASWERGYGDFHLMPDLSTLRRISCGWRAPRSSCATSTGRTARRSSRRRARSCGGKWSARARPGSSRCSRRSSSSTC